MRYRGVSFAPSASTPSNPLANLNRTTATAATSQPAQQQQQQREGSQPSESRQSTPTTDTPSTNNGRPSFLAARQQAAKPGAALASSYGKGAAIFARMGYVEGRGLGSDGSGILNPIEQKMRAGRLGLGGMKEKTKQDIEEAKRRGEKVEESEDESAEGGKAKKAKKRKREEFQARPRVSYRTVEEIEASGLAVPSVWKNVIDMTGAKSKIIEDMSGFKTVDETNTEDAERIQKAELARMKLEQYADEWESLQTRAKWVAAETERITKETDEETESIDRLGRVMELAIELREQTKLSGDLMASNPQAVLSSIAGKLDSLQFEFALEAERFRLDDVAIAALHPVLQKLMVDWDPIANPTFLKDYILRWQILLRVNATDRKEDGEDVAVDDIYLHHKRHLASKNRATLYESMMASIWLPRVRQALLNEWNVHDPAPIVLLLEEWHKVLPGFIEIQLIEQIVLPRLRAAVEAWNPKRINQTEPLPHVWIFPWMPFLKQNLDGLVADVRVKLGSVLRGWDVSKGVVEGLSAWKEVIGKDLDALLVRHIYPKLAGLLVSEFEVNPADQEMGPLLTVFKWRRLFRTRTFSTLLLDEFFPKWNGVLFLWLTSTPDFDEVEQWYQFWKKQFPKELLRYPEIESAFSRGLALINEAAALGARAADELQPITNTPDRKFAREQPSAPAQPDATSSAHLESTFKDVVEDFCLENNLLFIPLRKAHDLLGHPLYRITAAASGRGGFMCYFENEIMWVKARGNVAEDQLEWEPMDYNDIAEWAQFR
ncbi:GC-rich sequence DNA-binding factor-like protein-domain-containing protein [Myxozyma melibiosi]|uniref:GC-rich sequence DNA-binding factor-like protein-domain-containing protein n=1 Tax=Myxozyma melibiosi TaxID=54550 RepID=A0ABR1EZE0_9ASCO